MKRRFIATLIVLLFIISAISYVLINSAVTGKGPGSTTSSSAVSTASSVPSVLAGSWTTYHKDNARTGFEPASNFSSVRLDWRSTTLDGSIYAEPLVLGKDVYVATENNSVYSLNALTGAVRWRLHLGDPVPGAALPCGNINPSGITGTPVIDGATQTIYAVAFLNPPHHALFAIDIGSGTVRFQRTADAPGSDPMVQQQRAALTLANGMVYVPYGGLLGDCGQYHGWVVGINANGTGTMAAYQVPTAREGGIWGPSGAVVGPSGSLYVATGNGASGSNFDFGDSVIRLSPTLQEEGFFAPSNWAQLNRDDTDLGSLGPAIVDAKTIFQIGKEGVGYLLQMDSLGGIGGQLFSQKVCGSAYGGTAFSGPFLFVSCVDGLVALRVNDSSFTKVWQSRSFDSGPPIVTGELVWTVDVSNGTLHAFRMTDGQEVFSFALGNVTRFCTPASGDGRIFVAANDQVVALLS